MGLQCSILGHAFEPAGVERESEEEGDEVVTTEREIERCRRCGAERVVSASTEVTAVVDGEAVGLESDADGESAANLAGAGEDTGTDTAPASGNGPDASDDAITDVAGEDAAGGTDPDAVDRPTTARADDPEPGIENDAADPRQRGGEVIDPEPDRPDEEPIDDELRDPDSEDAEILTDEDTDREPGEWPDDLEKSDDGAGTDRVVETDAPVETPEETDESLSGITVPEGEIVCPECGFRIDAQSGYRGGDSCPECNGWLEAERNQ